MSLGYNGKPNYSTWCVDLWFSNDEGTYNDIKRLVRQSSSTYALSQAMKDIVEEQNPLGDVANMYSDMLNAAIREVDWMYLAEHWWKDEREEEE